jgi:cell fate regulator YaaT (PSP1 superfamily)
MYEHQTYVEARRRFPREGKMIRTSLGDEKVVAVDIWGQRVTLRDGEGSRRVLTLQELRSEVDGGTDAEATDRESRRARRRERRKKGRSE